MSDACTLHTSQARLQLGPAGVRRNEARLALPVGRALLREAAAHRDQVPPVLQLHLHTVLIWSALTFIYTYS